MFQEFFDPLVQSFSIIIELLPRLFALVAIILAGLLVAWIVRRVVLWLFTLLRLEAIARRLGLSNVFSTLRVGRPLPALLADAFYGLILVIFLIVGLDALDPQTPGGLVDSFHSFLPRILVAALILIAGYVVSVFVGQWVLVAAVNAQWKPARAISGGVQFLVLTLSLSMALEQLGVARGIVVSAFGLSFGGVVLALALAFGIGGAEIARKTLETRLGKGKEEEKPDEFSHL